MPGVPGVRIAVVVSGVVDVLDAVGEALREVRLAEGKRLLRYPMLPMLPVLLLLLLVRQTHAVRLVRHMVGMSGHRRARQRAERHRRADGGNVHRRRQRHVREALRRDELLRPPLVPRVERRRVRVHALRAHAHRLRVVPRTRCVGGRGILVGRRHRVAISPRRIGVLGGPQGLLDRPLRPSCLRGIGSVGRLV